MHLIFRDAVRSLPGVSGDSCDFRHEIATSVTWLV
jgi:hypothetical protein